MQDKKRGIKPFNLNMDKGTRDHLKQIMSYSRVPHTVASAIRELCRRHADLLKKQVEAEAQGHKLVMMLVPGDDGDAMQVMELDFKL